MTFPFPLFSPRASGGLQVARSLRFNSLDTAYLARTFVTGNRKTWTWSGWVKRGALGSIETLLSAYSANTDAGYLTLRFNALDQLVLTGGATPWRVSNAVFRDPTAWLHIVAAFDTTQGTATNRARVYVNNVELTWATNNALTLNTDYQINGNVAHYMGLSDSGAGGSYLFDGYLTDLYFIDGQALTPSSFGQLDAITGAWGPKVYAGAFGTTGFRLTFADNSAATAATLGKDSSGNGNNWSPTSFSVAAGVGNDSLLDSPTNGGTDTGLGGEVRGNYPTLNPLGTGGGIASDGNLKITGTAVTELRATQAFPRSGKWYFEVERAGANNEIYFGVIKDGTASSTAGTFVGHAGVGRWVMDDGSSGTTHSYYNNSTGVTTMTNGGTLVAASVNCMAVDMDTGNIWFGYNIAGSGAPTWYNSGAGVGNPATGAFPHATLTAGDYNAILMGFTGSLDAYVNFGQRAWKLTPPAGFKALCTQNLPDPAIILPGNYFGAGIHTGDGAATRSLTGIIGAAPDLALVKSRVNTTAAYASVVQDSVRGFGATTKLATTTQDPENSGQAVGTLGYVSAANASGIDLATTSTHTQTNENTTTYVEWLWTKGVLPGLDIIAYTGNGASPRALAHGLGVVPALAIVKSRSALGRDWVLKHQSHTAANFQRLNSVGGEVTVASQIGGGIDNLASAASINLLAGSVDARNVNLNAENYVAYVFAEVAGFSRFGTYGGTGTADGPFLWCGFRPKLVIIKHATSAFSWIGLDAARNPFNPLDKEIFLETTLNEATQVDADFVANGFKLRGVGTTSNASGARYIFMAFAEAPLKYARAR